MGRFSQGKLPNKFRRSPKPTLMNLVLYGPPSVGKTTMGKLIAEKLGREFVDGDDWIEARWGRPVPDYFERGDDVLFRAREAEACRMWSALDGLVIAPGGGALLDPRSRAALEGAGVILCLTASPETLLARLNGSHARPLLRGDAPARLKALLKERESLYRSFALQVNTDGRAVESVAEEVITQFRASEGVTRFELGESSALMGQSLLARLPELLAAKGLRPPFAVISDSSVAPLYGDAVCRALLSPSPVAHPACTCGAGTGGRNGMKSKGRQEKGSAGEVIHFPAGEAHKNLDTVRELYSACLACGLERGGTILALGGGVVGDVAGFIAATFMRGVQWVNLPTTVLAMADASLGGKVGVDLPEGKNLVGAFHPPSLILADFDTLSTLPAVETRCGLAEVVKAAVIGDGALFAQLSSFTADQGAQTNPSPAVINHAAADPTPAESSLAPLLRCPPAFITRAAAVKVGIVNADPYERGERARLNFGHTIGHGVESASGYAIRHGEAVAIGMIAETRLAEAMGLVERGLSARIAACLQHIGLPTRATGLSPQTIRAAMSADKKKAGRRLKFALPKQIGEVVWGIEVDEELLLNVLKAATHER